MFSWIFFAVYFWMNCLCLNSTLGVYWCVDVHERMANVSIIRIASSTLYNDFFLHFFFWSDYSATHFSFTDKEFLRNRSFTMDGRRRESTTIMENKKRANPLFESHIRVKISECNSRSRKRLIMKQDPTWRDCF